MTEQRITDLEVNVPAQMTLSQISNADLGVNVYADEIKS